MSKVSELQPLYDALLPSHDNFVKEHKTVIASSDEQIQDLAQPAHELHKSRILLRVRQEGMETSPFLGPFDIKHWITQRLDKIRYS